MKDLKEYTNSAYPTSISNSQSQEYGGVFAPFDAETTQGKDRLNVLDPEGLHRFNAFLKYYFRRTTLNPKYDIDNLRVRMNHMNLDFITPTKLESDNDIEVSTGGQDVFGVTPTTDLSKGFYKGEDLPKFNLNVKVEKTDGGYKVDASLSPKNKVAESMMHKVKRNKRIKSLKEMISRSLSEQEIAGAKEAVDVKGDKFKETMKSRKREDRELKT
jgi:hypothetical protein